MYEININNGIGEIKFGMNPSQVKHILGEKLQYEEWMGGNLENFLFYEGILIGFEGEIDEHPTNNSFVCMFQIKNKLSPSIFGVNIENYSKIEIKELLNKQNLKNNEITSNIIQVTNKELQFTFNEQFKLDEIYIGNKNT